MPHGSYAEHWEMERAQSELEEYLDDMREYSDCLEMEREDAAMEVNRVLDDWNDSVTAYNNR